MRRLDDWLEKVAEARTSTMNKFSPNELEAESLRQEIRALEQDSLDPEKKHEIFVNAKKIKYLKSRLDEVRVPAELDARGRQIGQEMFGLAKHMMQNNEAPPNYEEIIDRYQRQIADVQEKEKIHRQAEREEIKRQLKMSSWPLRLQLVNWYSRVTLYRTFRQALPRAIASASMKILRR